VYYIHPRDVIKYFPYNLREEIGKAMNLRVRHSVKFPLKLGLLLSCVRKEAQSKLSPGLLSCYYYCYFHVYISGSGPRVWETKKLFTPGPLLCSPTVKAALNYDLGSRDTQFIQILRSVRQSLVQVAGCLKISKIKYT